jgi:hypothetical protein
VVNGRPARNIRVGSTRWRGVAGRRLSRRRLSCWCSEVTTGWVSTGCRRLRGGIWRGLSGRRRIRMISVWVGIGSICCEREQRTSEACSRGMAEPAGLPGFCRFRLRELGNFPKLPTLCLFRLRLRGWGFGRLGFWRGWRQRQPVRAYCSSISAGTEGRFSVFSAPFARVHAVLRRLLPCSMGSIGAATQSRG